MITYLNALKGLQNIAYRCRVFKTVFILLDAVFEMPRAYNITDRRLTKLKTKYERRFNSTLVFDFINLQYLYLNVEDILITPRIIEN